MYVFLRVKQACSRLTHRPSHTLQASYRLGHNFIFKNVTQCPFYRSTNTERDLFSDRYCIFRARQELHEVH